MGGEIGGAGVGVETVDEGPYGEEVEGDARSAAGGCRGRLRGVPLRR